MTNQKKNYDGLTALRGMATFLIVFHHANADCIPTLPYTDGLFSFILWRLRNFGWSAVDLFFVLSGFLFAHSFFSASNLPVSECVRPFQLKSYYIKRAARIIPTYYILVVVLALTNTGIIHGGKSQLSLTKGLFIYFGFFHNYLATHVCGPVWFLGVIVHAYILLPLLFLFLQHILKINLWEHLGTIAVVIILVTVASRTGWVLSGNIESNDFMFSHFRMDSIFVGMLGYKLLNTVSPTQGFITQHRWILLFASILLTMPSMFFHRSSSAMFSVGYTVLAIGYGGIIVALSFDNRITDLKLTPLLKPIANWSYGIYLWHWYIVFILAAPNLSFFQMLSVHIPNIYISTIVQIAIFILLSILIGMASTKLIEQPAAQFLLTKLKKHSSSP